METRRSPPTALSFTDCARCHDPAPADAGHRDRPHGRLVVPVLGMMEVLGVDMIAASWMRPGRTFASDAAGAQSAVMRVGLNA